MSDPVNLDEELKKGRYTHAWLATYNFGAAFFEHYCLEKYQPLAEARSVVVFLDHGQYEALRTDPEDERPQQVGLRYMLCPVRCQSRFHAKFALFAAGDRGLLVFGSANLTRSGLTQNAEFAAVFRHGPDDPRHLQLFGDVVRLVAALVEESRSPSVVAAYQALRDECPWLTADDDGSRTRPRILHSLREPLWSQVFGEQRGQAARCAVLSPYFDARPELLGHHLAQDLAGARVTIYSQKGPRSLSPAWQAHADAHPSVELYFTRPGEDDRPRTLHAKAVLVATPREAVLAFGSANFTRAGWCTHQRTGNVETVLAIRGLPPDFDVTGLFDPSGTRKPPAPDELIGGAGPPPTASPAPALHLLDAWYDEPVLVLAVLPGPAIARWEAELSPREGDPARVVLTSEADGRRTCRLDPALAARCARGATTVRLLATTAAGAELVSNPVYLVQLQDPVIGRAARLDRRIREAQQDSEHFAAVLQELAVAGDLAALRRFFRCCDLRLGDRRGSVFVPRTQVSADAPRRRFEAPAPVIHAELHDAAQAFFEAHLARLRRHAQAPEVAAAPRFMAIAHDLAIVQAWRLDGVFADLQKSPRRKTADQWKHDRGLLNAILGGFRDLLALLARVYLPKLKPHPASPDPCAWADDVAGLQSHAHELLRTRARFDAVPVRVPTPMGPRPAPFFATDVLEVGHWRTWTREVTDDARRLAGGG